MPHLVNDARVFAAAALAGFADANPDRVRPAGGGVIRATVRPAGRVGVLMGGGSGHFPAFAGWVGAGFGDGAACGDVFASPSERQILAVARAIGTDRGLLFAPINYAGDILHFTAAAEALRREDVDVRLVPITDDIASGGGDERDARRGIAGSFIVLKIIGAAAERELDLDALEAVARAANDATRTLGVAFTGCTLPGAAAPLFTVRNGTMAIGLGIHGEPGIEEAPLSTADDAADAMIDRLFAERAPEPGRRVAMLINGLGGTTPDELSLIFSRARDRVDASGMRLVAPVVGQQVTSYDMAGASISLCYLDEQLESLWLDPADAASFHRGGVARLAPAPVVAPPADPLPEQVVGSRASHEAATPVVEMIAEAAERIESSASMLGDLDAVAGDGDHGIGMARGLRAAATASAEAHGGGAGVGGVLRQAGLAWADVGGGTSGALWGAGLVAAGESLGDHGAPSSLDAVRAVGAFVEAVVERGGAEIGDKTMVDALIPFLDELEASGDWLGASEVATARAAATSELVARRGRARTHGDRSLGTPDPGAVSFAIIAATAAQR